jgi:mono/diheme cytochrome c family protein
MSRYRPPIGPLIAMTTLLLTAATPGAQRKPRMAATENSDIARGQKIYGKSCEVCHFAASTVKKIGPGLKDIVKKEKFSNGWKVNDENLALWIERGGKDMPPSHLNREQVRELIAYLKTL